MLKHFSQKARNAVTYMKASLCRVKLSLLKLKSPGGGGVMRLKRGTNFYKGIYRKNLLKSCSRNPFIQVCFASLCRFLYMIQNANHVYDLIRILAILLT